MMHRKKFLLIVLVAIFANACSVTSRTGQLNTPADNIQYEEIAGSGFNNAPSICKKYIPILGIEDGSKFSVRASVPEKGIVAINYHFESLLGSPQDISILEIDPSRFDFKVLDHKGLKRTSQAASELEAVAAMNGTFYDMKKGGSVCYLQIDGVVSDTTKGKDMRVRANGAVVIKKGKLSVEPWSQDKEKVFRSKLQRKTSVMATMPLLVKDGYAVELVEYKGFSDKRHPRSVVFEKDGKICLMVIDGRSKGNAAGMTLDEVQRYLLSMDGGKGCDNAVNLDGGGSSTLWISPVLSTSSSISSPSSSSSGNFSPNVFFGVLNHPSDNGKFDNKGERRVANSIIVIKK